MADDLDLDTEHGRLKCARVRAGYPSKAAFAKAVSIDATTYRAYENGQNGYAKYAAIFAKRLGVSAEWLLEGGPLPEGPAPPKPRLPDTIDEAPDRPPTRSASEGETYPVIAVDLSLSMGPGTVIEEFPEEEPIHFDIGFLRTITRTDFGRLRLVRGIGDSMEPTLRTGDRVLVDINDRQLTRLDGIYWITLHGAHGIKRLKPAGRGRVLVVSDNRDVSDPVEVDADDVTIEGRVIWMGRDL